MRNDFAGPVSGWARIEFSLDRWREPRPSGLPNARVIAGFPALLAIVFVVLVSLGVTGSSTGILHGFLENGPDQDLISGEPQAIRSDEWFVQTSWTISQVEQGLPLRNESFPGGMDATVQHDLPSRDWSVAFRPHLLGFFFLPLDNAMAVKWWLPGLALIAGTYFFMITLLPRRPMSSAFLAVASFFAPYVQWWYLSITLWTATWCVLVMAAIVWLIREERLWPRAILVTLVAYSTVTMGMGIYVPFIVPAAFVALAFGAGMVLTQSGDHARGTIASRFRSILPILAAGVVGIGILGLWIVTRLPTIEGFVSTVYPGQRLERTGSADGRAIISYLSAPVTARLGREGGVPINSNASEASSFFLPGLFLVVPAVWMFIDRLRRRKTVDWMLLCLMIIGGLFIAFLLIPGWDGLAHALLLDRTTVARLPMGLGLLSVVAVAVFIARIDAHAKSASPQPPQWTSVAAVLTGAVLVAVPLVFLFRRGAPLVTETWSWLYISVLYLAAVFLLSRGLALVASLCLLAIALLGSASVNPLYRGVFDVNDTALVEEMKGVSVAEPGRWVGVGESFLPTVVLVQSGLDSYNGFQSAPADEMWNQIDPTNRYEERWNRLANVSWRSGNGEPIVKNPAPDQIQLSFDSCSAFAQKNVEHVLSDAALSQPCLSLDDRVRQGPTNLWIYDVVAAR